MCKAPPDLLRFARRSLVVWKELRTKVYALEVSGESGAGMVKVTLRGSGRVKKVDLAQNAMVQERETIEDLVASAMNKAQDRMDDEIRNVMNETLPDAFDPSVVDLFRFLR